MPHHHPKPVSEMTREELISEIEKYAASARRTFDAGKDPWAALSRVRAMIERYKDLSKPGDRGAPEPKRELMHQQRD